MGLMMNNRRQRTVLECSTLLLPGLGHCMAEKITTTAPKLTAIEVPRRVFLRCSTTKYSDKQKEHLLKRQSPRHHGGVLRTGLGSGRLRREERGS